MAQSAFFHGKALNAVDAKGRVSLPADMRAVIERRHGPILDAEGRTMVDGDGKPLVQRDLFVSRHADLPCLVAFDLNHQQTLVAEIEETLEDLPGKERPAARAQMQTDRFGDLEKTSFDAAGRMVLPPRPRRQGKIGGLAFFIGAGQIVQVWDPETYLASPTVSERNKEDLRDLLASREGRA